MLKVFRLLAFMLRGVMVHFCSRPENDFIAWATFLSVLEYVPIPPTATAMHLNPVY